MICSNCRQAGDVKKRASNVMDNKLLQDMIGKVKTLHAKCNSIDCFCQHRLTK